MVEYFSLFQYIYIFYFLDKDNFPNISLFFIIIFYFNYETKIFIKTTKNDTFFFILNLKYFENVYVFFNFFSHFLI